MANANIENVASYPAIYVTGPVHHWVRVWGTRYPKTYYLGTAESRPSVQIEYLHQPFKDDRTGEQVAQLTNQGRSARLSVVLNRFDASTMLRLRGENLIGCPGELGAETRGRPVFGVLGFELWQVFECATTNNNLIDYDGKVLYPQLPYGYYWPNVAWASLEDTPGNVDQKYGCSWRAFEKRKKYSSAVPTKYVPAYMLFSQNPSDFPTDVLSPL